MTEYYLEGTTKTPEIKLNGETGIFEFSGRSIPEISFEFYAPMFSWLENYARHPKPTTIVHTKFEYFNTSSSKSILDFFKALEDLHENGYSAVTIKWYHAHDDDAMEEAGEEYKLLVKVPFEIISVVVDN